MRQFIAYMSILLVLVACGSPRVVTSDISTAEGEEAKPLVFGRVIVNSSKAPEVWTETDCTTDIFWTCPDSFRLFILKEDDPKPITYRLTGDGSFAFPLEPGEYFLAEWQWCQKCVNIHNYASGRLGASFTIEEGDIATYVGHLVIEFRGRRYGFDVSDDFEVAVATLATRRQDVAEKAHKNILTIHRVPDGAAVIPVCHSTWGATCNDSISGVEPIDPPQKDGDFPKVSDLSPSLKWQAVEDENVTYDIIVYEAFPYGPPLSRRYVQGQIVQYAHGVSGTSYKIERTLKPDTKYFWTIRLRRGDVVSEWSSTSYRKFGFFIVAAISQSAAGVPYRFSTP